MKVFHCDHCGALVFFENIQCLACGHRLAFLPDLIDVCSLDPVAEGKWSASATSGAGGPYRLCHNYVEGSVCNWAIDASDANPYCLSCRLTRVIPDLSKRGNAEAWYRLEVAKCRVLYTILQLGLLLESEPCAEEATIGFEYLEDAPDGATWVSTGHSNGIVTVNIAEADDVERERRRKAMGEPYRTLLGHLRHEVGHYYWNALVKTAPVLDGFRERFGDDREDYTTALQRYYEHGPAPDWQSRFVSAYASAHPWEDWAETWAHYLHMVDSLETAAECGLSLRPSRHGEPKVVRVKSEDLYGAGSFDRMISSWHAVTYLLNSLNRGMELADAYPFVLAPAAVEKLRFVHEAVGRRARRTGGSTAVAGSSGHAPTTPAQ